MLGDAAPDTAETTKDAPAKEAPAFDIKVQPGDALFAAPPRDTRDATAGESTTAKPGAAKPKIDAAELKLLPAPARAPDSTTPAAPARPRRGRLARYAASTLVVAGLCGLAFAAGAHGGLGRAAVDVVSTSPAPAADTRGQTDDLTNMMRQMADDLRALKARVDQQEAAPTKAPDPAAANAGVAQLATRIDGLDSRVTSKLAQLGDQIAALQQPAAGRRAAATAHVPVAHARPAEKHAKHVHDAFDPTLDPYAPGAPRPLGSR